ncbi:hypothetical protein AVEN_22639-1 [Araneus ventricosus]|uniref:Uncharacterized protein n=1 Tax=Araneus ventricosus TaxID=182803 RepID=A0A4Y2JUG3_ARAVE|nr:hypothetical protein AVEN_22639-1 [Araneus ventricosus]
MGFGWQGALELDSLLRLSPKRSQNLTSPQKKPSASDWSSLLLRESFRPPGDHFALCERIKVVTDHLLVPPIDHVGSALHVLKCLANANYLYKSLLLSVFNNKISSDRMSAFINIKKLQLNVICHYRYF